MASGFQLQLPVQDGAELRIGGLGAHRLGVQPAVGYALQPRPDVGSVRTGTAELASGIGLSSARD